MTITQITTAHGGETIETELPTAGGVSRSTDYIGGGVAVQDGFGSREVHDPSDLRGDELVSVDGMEIKASMAKEMGLLDKLFAPARMNRPVAPPNVTEEGGEAKPESAPSETPEPGTYAEAEANLNAALEAGTIEFVEANEVATALGEAALTGWDLERTQEVLEGLREGSIDATDLSANEQQVAEAVETKITNAQTASARAELGMESFNHLQQIAQSNPEVNEAIRGYGIQRAQGRADVSWSEFFNEVMDHVNGR